MASKKNKKPLTDDEKYEFQVQEEMDLARLQRQYTLMERDRAAFYEDSGKLSKHDTVIQIFKNEQKNLLTDLVVATTGTKTQEDKKVSIALCELLDEHDDFTSKIKMKKAHLDEIDYQMKQFEKSVHELTSKQITDYQYQARVLAGQNTLDALENKLEVQVKKFCAICADNRRLRGEIDHLLKERIDFNKIWDKLILNLKIGKKFMLDLIEQATIAYDQREEWCSKLQALRMRAHNDLLHHTQEMRELQRNIDDNNKLEEFFTVKGQKRIMKDLEEKEMLKRAETKEKTQMLLTEYLEMVNSVMEFTGEDDIKEIAKKFYKYECENFSMFSYINELNREMEELNDELGKLHFEIDEQKVFCELRTKTQQNTLEYFDQQYNQIKSEADNIEKQVKDAEANLSTMTQGIMKLFKLCKCQTDPLVKLLSDNSNITYYNVHLYLEILEKKVHQLMLNVYHKEKTALDRKKMKSDLMVIQLDKTKPKIYDIEKIVSTNPCPLCVEHEMVSDVIDVLQKVWDRDTAQQKLNQRLELPDGLEKVHNVSACHLPKSRQIIQKRYQ